MQEYMYLAFSKILWNTNLEEHLPHLLFYFLCLTFFYVNQSLKYILGGRVGGGNSLVQPLKYGRTSIFINDFN